MGKGAQEGLLVKKSAQKVGIKDFLTYICRQINY